MSSLAPALIALAAVVSLPAAELRLGRAAVKITPPAGTPMGGDFYIQPSTGVHDDLYCKALVFAQDASTAALVSCDVESLHRPTVLKARALIEQSTGIPGARAMLTATHSHSGPEMTPLVVESARGEPARLLNEFHESLPARIAEAVRLAKANLAPARAWAGSGSETAVSFNRRYLMRDAGVRTNPGIRNPDIVRAAGPIDPDLPVLYFDAPSGSAPLATLTSFALHSTAWGRREFSADYPGALAARLAEFRGPDMLTVFLQGCSGNINQVDVSSGEPQFGPGQVSRIATILAAGVLKTYANLRPIDPARLVVRRAVVPLPVPRYSAEQVRQAHSLIERARTDGRSGPPFLEVVNAFRIVNVAEYHGGKPIPAEVQVIALGDQAAIVGLPGEVFAELGMAVKRGSPFPLTIVAELSNDMLDYLPDRKAFPEGSYEPTTARCLPGCGEALADGAVKLLIEAYTPSPPAREARIENR